MKWKPKIGDAWFFIIGRGMILMDLWHNYRSENQYRNFGNCFRTHKQAQQMAKKIKEMLKGT